LGAILKVKHALCSTTIARPLCTLHRWHSDPQAS